MYFYDITPVAKPRMTQRDRWAKRKATAAYWAFKDECRLIELDVPDSSYITFGIPMPASWSKAKRAKHFMQPHRQRPDIDNLIKALLDAVYDEDSQIHEISAKKMWVDKGMIIVESLA